MNQQSVSVNPYTQAISLVSRGFRIVAVTSRTKRPVAKWEQLTRDGPNRDVQLAHLDAIRRGEADTFGVVCGISNLVCIDIDATNKKKPIDYQIPDNILVRLDRSFVDGDGWSWRSMSGAGWHIWLAVSDLPPDVTRLVFPANGAENIAQIEIRARGHYTIIPPTVCVPDAPPPTATWDDLRRAVEKTLAYYVRKSEKDATTSAPHLNGHQPVAVVPARESVAIDAYLDDPERTPRPPTRQEHIHDDPERTPRPPTRQERTHDDTFDALNDWLQRVRTATEGTRNDTLVRAAFVAGRYVAAGLVDRGAIEGELLRATALPAREATATIRSGVEAGMQQPWEVHAPTRPGRRTGTNEHDRSPERPSKPTPAQLIKEGVAALAYRFLFNAEIKRVWFQKPGMRQPKQFEDEDFSVLYTLLSEMGIRHLGGLHHVIVSIAMNNPIQPVRDTLTTLVWDGQPHIARLASYLHVESGVRHDLATDWLSIWLLGAARRVLDHVHNVVLVLEGTQGIGKSMFVRWLGSVGDGLYTEKIVNPTSRDCRLALSRYLVWEISEIDAVTNRHEAAELKSFISLEEVDERAVYARLESVRPALASFVATTNAINGYLTDPTGNRRFLPLPLKAIDWRYADEIDVRQVWAEAVARYRAGELPALLAKAAHERQVMADERRIRSLVDDWIDAHFVISNDPNDVLTSAEIVAHLVARECRFGGTERSAAMAIATALTARNLQRVRRVTGGGQVRGWQGIRRK